MAKHTITLTRERETPKTVVFKGMPEQPGQTAKIETLYIPKWVEGIEKAQAVQVTVEVAA